MTRINFLLITASLIIIDQLSKCIIRHSGGFYICNPGIAFGIQIPEVLFWIVYAIIIGFALLKLIHLKIPLCFSLLKKGEDALAKFFLPRNTYCIIFILSGALSNLIDRLRYGCVIDFIDLKFWPVFNLADVFITIGGIILLSRIVKRGTHSVKRRTRI